MNVIAFLFYAALAVIFLGLAIPYAELVAGICALVLAIKSL